MGRGPGAVVVVATPIGNLDDLSPRAAKALCSADIVACEDTRRTAKLLRHVGAEVAMISTHEHNEVARAGELVNRALRGQVIALVTDAGMPGLSDPGRAVVDAAHEAGVAVTVLPGASAAAAAIAASGFPGDRHRVLGFLPHGGARRARALDELAGAEVTTVLFESPRRLPDLLAGLAERDPDREVLVARELTKLHEEIVRGSATELAERYSAVPRGEVTVAVAPAVPRERGEEDLVATLGTLLDVGLSPSMAADAAAALGVGPRNAVYRAALAAAASRSER